MAARLSLAGAGTVPGVVVTTPSQGRFRGDMRTRLAETEKLQKVRTPEHVDFRVNGSATFLREIRSEGPGLSGVMLMAIAGSMRALRSRTRWHSLHRRSNVRRLQRRARGGGRSQQPQQEVEGMVGFKSLRDALEAAAFSAKSALVGVEWADSSSSQDPAVSGHLRTKADRSSKSVKSVESGLRARGAVGQAFAKVEDNSFEAVAAAEKAISLTSLGEGQQSQASIEVVQNETEKPELPAMEGVNYFLRLSAGPKSHNAEEVAGVDLLMSQSVPRIAELMLQGYFRKLFRKSVRVRPVDVRAGTYDVEVPSIRLNLPFATVTSRPVTVAMTCKDMRRTDGSLCERGYFDVVLEDGKDICCIQLGFPFQTSYFISAAAWGRTAIGWQGQSIQLQVEGDAGIRLLRVPGLRSVIEYFARVTLNEAVKDGARILAGVADNAVED
mmetsp:Transcript_31956/g.74838  ORF Transcript_31956/g.74838 Transcript_31956/m.74838 type:complete len:441 (+) Transcript_31956:107-1429(+)|eukprot:CAMPEP_0178437552 /NCGR_PEP_ID=MMETSP0689_2-20121128/35068_1 /TAXON_ID=160604 /ORGANISM="Amphidinium massartii, Strain CS-259" /LENGTH=440 /DNA_ID=CAMNT_0020059791 /DNA_START=21 /DNA_END=1343 /DNA_ORIENTATION=+